MDASDIKAYYAREKVVAHYARAASLVGLWRSEEAVLRRVFKTDDSLIDVGTGTGRIAIGLYEIGYQRIMGIDNSREMIDRARRLAQLLDYPIPFRLADATQFDFGEGIFEGAIFGFNGLMQIPGRENRRACLRRIRHAVAPGGAFVFTTHDRELPTNRPWWRGEAGRWERGEQGPELLEFGDRFEPTDLGQLFIHIPDRDEVLEDLTATGWEWEADFWRSSVGEEPEMVVDFSDECRFWVVRRPVKMGD